MLRIGELKKQHARPPSLGIGDQLFNPPCVHPRGDARILRVKLLKGTICINVAVKIAGWLLNELVEGERDLCMAERRMKPIFVGRYSSPDWPKEHRLGIAAP